MIRIIRYLFYLCIALAMWECSSQSDSILNPNTDLEEPEITLCLQVNLNDAVGTDFPTTRDDNEVTDLSDAKFEGAAWTFEKIHTLRVIIVRPDNTVEHNRLVSLPGLESVNKFGELEFKVSTDQGTFSTSNPTERTETKRVFLVANEAAIQPESILNTIRSLKEGDKIELSNDGAPSWIMENTSWSGYAMPIINNDDKEDEKQKLFVPMTEFFNVDVKVDLNQTSSKIFQYEKMFITRTLIKFEFSVEGEGIDDLKINSIKFGNLNQKEYLFPYQTEYSPGKYTQLSDDDEGRIITKYTIPENNLSASYIFSPDNFGFKKNAPAALSNVYRPQLYFCESQNFNGTPSHDHIYEVSISGIMTSDKNITQDFKFTPKSLPNLASLPRNTVVKIHFIVKTYDLLCEVVVFPYTAINLNPEFGFAPPISDVLTIAPTMELNMITEGLLSASYTSTVGTKIDKLIWVSSDPSIILLEPEKNDPDPESQLYVKPSDSIELPLEERIKVLPQKQGTTYITVYSQTGLVARCKVTVK